MLGDRILELRSMRSWSQVTLAKRLGVTKQAVSNWENGNIQPSIEMLLRLARLLRWHSPLLCVRRVAHPALLCRWY